MTEKQSAPSQTKTLDDLLNSPFEMQPQLKDQDDPINEKLPVKIIDRLSEEEKQKAYTLAAQIPAGNYEAILTYGANAQTELSRFSHQMLDHVQKKDIGPVGDILKDLMDKLGQMNPEELTSKKKSGIKRIFGKVSRSVQELMTKYQKLSTQIDRIGIQLEHSKRGLIEDVHMLDKLYDQNKASCQALNG